MGSTKENEGSSFAETDMQSSPQDVNFKLDNSWNQLLGIRLESFPAS